MICSFRFTPFGFRYKKPPDFGVGGYSLQSYFILDFSSYSCLDLQFWAVCGRILVI